MFRFYKTQSGRCYVEHKAVVHFYFSDEEAWVPTEKTVDELTQDTRVVQCKDEDDFPPWARRKFRTQFGFDSRRVVRR